MKDVFVDAIRDVLKDDANGMIVTRLAQILPLGKEAIYRRLNGVVNFSLTEAVLVAKSLNLSLDKIFLGMDDSRASFNLNLINTDNPAWNYPNILSGYIQMFDKITKMDQTSLRSAYNVMPYSFILNHSQMSRFHLYKWLYLVKAIDQHITFSEYRVPENLLYLQRRFKEKYQSIHTSSIIIARDIFVNFAEDILLFFELDLINEEEKDMLKRDLFEIIKTIESIATTGYYSTGKEVSIYLANINFDASYTHFEIEGLEIAHFRVFSINGIESTNSEICKQSKMWIDSLQHYSTSITRSDNMHRSLYFEEQRTRIMAILD